MAEQDDKKRGANLLAGLAVGGVVLVVGGGIFDEVVWPHIHGATPTLLVHQPLDRTPKQMGHDLPSTDVHDTDVTVRFRIGAATPYETAQFHWDDKSLDAPNMMNLSADHDHGEEVPTMGVLEQRLHRMERGSYHWGPVSFTAQADGNASFSVQRTIGDQPNPSFVKEMAAARDVLLNAAFSTPVSFSDQELTNLLGTGYPLADVGRFDPATPIEDATTLATTMFPASALVRRSGDIVEIPLDDAIFERVRISWRKDPRGGIQRVDVQTMDEAFKANRDALVTCLGSKLGAPQVKGTDAAFTIGTTMSLKFSTFVDIRVTQPIDAASWRQTFDALGTCAASLGASSKAHGDARKK